MKNISDTLIRALIKCFLFASLSLISCNKEDMAVYNAPAHRLKTVSYFTDNGLHTTYSYEYDSRDWVSTLITRRTASNDVFKSTCDYQPQTFIINEFRNDTLIDTETINLDDKGLINDGKYLFDFEGNVIRYYLNIQNNDYVEQTWVDGNIISASFYIKSKLSYIYKYHYDLSKANSIYVNNPIYGKRNKNLVTYYEYIRPGYTPPSKYYYEYQFDNNERVLRQVLPGGNYYTFTYYD